MPSASAGLRYSAWDFDAHGEVVSSGAREILVGGHRCIARSACIAELPAPFTFPPERCASAFPLAISA